MVTPDALSATPGSPVAAPLLDDGVAPDGEADYDDDFSSIDTTAGDSSYGTDEAGSALYYESVGSSAYLFPLENGRTYHAYQEGKYLLPNDEKEQDRMDMVYHSLNKMFEDTLFFAPVKNPQRIADMATGTGIWAMDVGDKYKSAQVIGIDLSPIQPRWVPPNVQFRVDDIDKDWVFEHPLDLVHSRICSGNAIRDWPKYLSQAFSVLKPGGWVEAQEFDIRLGDEGGTLPVGSLIVQWHHELADAFARGGCDLHFSGEQLRRQMADAGFVNVHVAEYRWPISPWHEEERMREAGAFAMLSMLEDLEGISMASMTRHGGWEAEELKVFLDGVTREWRLKGQKGYWPLFVVYGQRPE